MPVAAALRAAEVEVEPGQTALVDLRITNSGTIVEQFTFELVGEPAAWAEVVPPSLSLFPGTEQTATVRFSPPRLWSTPAGAMPFAVKITPSTDPEQSTVEEGTVTVGRFDDLSSDLVPRLTSARITGRQQLAVDNRGNVPMVASLTAADPSQALDVQFRPKTIALEPGRATFARVVVKPHQRFWRGPPKPRPYKVLVQPEDSAPVSTEGTLTQKPILPKGLLPLLVLGALAALWFLLFKPAIQSTATSAVNQQLAAQQAQTNALATQLASTNSQVKSLSSTSTTTTTTTTAPPTTTTTAAPAGGGPVATTTTAPAPTTSTSPNQNALTVTGPAGQTTQSTFTVPTGNTVTITDLVFENVAGTNGRVRFQRVPAGNGATPQTLMVENLNNLTDQEYRFTTPMVFSAGQQMVLAVDCTSNQPACEVNMFYTGNVTQPAK